MALNLKNPSNPFDGIEPELTARIAVFGVGGAGGNAVNNMIDKQLPGVEFIAANTDSQALAHSKAARKLQLGTGVTRGLGAGSKPDVGYTAAEETIEEIAGALEGCHMCFITAGMGGGTGTGAAPVVARVAREMGILSVGVVTKPFHFEGARRMAIAEAGVNEMQKGVDTLIVIPNQNLFQVASERTTFVEAFVMADDVLYQGVQGVTDLMVRPGMINLDFADVKSVMEEMGKAMMGTGEADGDTRAIDAAEKAIANPLLDEVSLKGAKGVLINITGGYDLTLFEMDEAANRIKEEVDADALIKFGSALDPEMEGRMRVSVVATGIDAESMERPEDEEPQATRRRPAETDRGLLSAVRGAVSPRKPPAAMPLGQPVAGPTEEAVVPSPATAKAEERPDVFKPGGTARGRLVISETARVSEPEAAPAKAAPAPTPADQVEDRAARAPSPEDIRARAEAVRQRASEARTQRAPQGGDEGLFGMEAGALDPGSLAAPRDPAPKRGGSELSARREGGERASTGLFTINKLIHRVAGGQAEPRAEPTRSQRSREEDDGDIPAFLRRQAN
ncbi:MAG: cell division protein FtsZ [Pseudomonadota bacterium]